MGKNTFGKTMPRALSQNLKIMGEQIMLARKRRHRQGDGDKTDCLKGGTWRPDGFYGYLCACSLCT